MSITTRRLVLGSGVALAALTLAWMRPSRASKPLAATPAAAEASPSPPRVAGLSPSRAELSPVYPGVAGGPSPEPPIIDSIELEKTEVCIGEENVVTVHAHTADGRDDALLRYRIDGHWGKSVPLRAYPPGWGDPIEVTRTVTVYGRLGTSTTAPLPRYEVKPCRPKRALHLEQRAADLEGSAVTLVAHVASIGQRSADGMGIDEPEPLAVARYRWAFGDGTTAESEGPEITHDFGDRPQERGHTSFLVACEAVSESGESVTGHVALELENQAFASQHERGVVRLAARRGAVVTSDDAVTERVRFSHDGGEPVTISRVLVTRLRLDRLGEQSAPEEARPEAVLGAAEIPPSGIEAALTLDRRAEGPIAAKRYRIEGRTQGGRPVVGSFTLKLPDVSVAQLALLENPAFRAKVARAREILGRDDVRVEDVRRLEREGQLLGMPAEAGGPPPGEPPPR